MNKDDLEKLGIRLIPGNKGPNDQIIYYYDNPITMKELGAIFDLLCKNEDKIYPKPRFRGGDMLQDFLNDIRAEGGMTDEILRKYKLS